MEKYYIKVIRFINKEIEYNIDHVNKLIEYEVQGRIQSPPVGDLGVVVSGKAGGRQQEIRWMH
jgi:hypothetical protein